MTQFDEKTIRETAYYIWKNNGCPANSSTHDWNAAIEQLEQRDALSTAKQISAAYLASRIKADAKKKDSLQLMRKIILK